MLNHLLVTGCYRSGTTLLEKLLHNHPSIAVASQPCPILYQRTKAAFLDQRGVQQRYPLGHLRGDQAERLSLFERFLDTYQLDTGAISDLFDDLESYTKGLWTPEILHLRGRIQPGTFLEVLRQFDTHIVELFGNTHTRLAGGKEVLVEEYVPYLLRRGHRVVLSLRDPRDMICSLNFGDRDNLTGQNRPVLFSLRAWRKSVAVALAYEDHPSFCWLRYEDLVRRPISELNRLTPSLGVDPYSNDLLKTGLLDQRGKIWMGNSSFSDQHGVTSTSVGRYEKGLPDEVRECIESCCRPEMVVLGYLDRDSTPPGDEAIRTYRDPFTRVHSSFPADYSSDPRRVAEEIERLKMLESSEKPSQTEIVRQFIFSGAFEKLRTGLSRATS
jgi:hypothetical protein